MISDKSDLYQNLQKNKTPVKAALVAMVRALAFLETGSDQLEINVDFDDSIIEDTNTTVDRNIKLVQGGLRSKLTAIMEINKCSETEAKKELERIAEDSQITGQDIDWTEGDHAQEQKEEEVENEPPGESEES